MDKISDIMSGHVIDMSFMHEDKKSAASRSTLSSEKAFVVPSLAVRKDISGNYVYVIERKDNKNIVAKKYVTRGLSFDENSMITSGLDLNDQVVIEGYHLVSSGVSVNLVK